MTDVDDIEPVEVAELEEAELAASNPELAAQGKRFFFGEIGVLKFEDGSSYHVRHHHVTITNPKLIENVLTASKVPHNKIFPED